MHEASNNTEKGEPAKSACCGGHNHTGHDHPAIATDHHAHVQRPCATPSAA